MKKILALVLAVAMLSTTAFATTLVAGVASVGEGEVMATGNTNFTNPGTTLRIYPEAFGISSVMTNGTVVAQLDNDVTGWRLCPEYFTISAKKFSKGANLVKEVKFNEDKCTIDIVLKDDFALTRPKGENLVIDNLSIKAKKEYKTPATVTADKEAGLTQGDIRKNGVYKYASVKALKYNADTDLSKTPTAFKVGYKTIGVSLDNSPEYKNEEIAKFQGSDTVSYETASITEGDVYVEGRVYNKDKCYVGIDTEINKEVLKLDDTASMRFYNITTNGLPTANVLKLTGEESEFVYKIVDDKIVASGLKWNADESAFVGKIRSSAKYVISDVELKAAPAVEGDKPATANPDTGANDVVGIAAALAVVSLVAAGAVSMKK